MIAYLQLQLSIIWRVKNLEPPDYFAQVATLYKRQREITLFSTSLIVSYAR